METRFRDYSNLDGEVIEYDILSGGSNMTRNHFDQDNFYSNAGGLLSRTTSDTIFNKKERMRRRNLREDKKQTKVGSKATAREQRTGAKVEAAKANANLADSLGKSGSTAELPKDEKQGMSTIAKVGIGVAVLAVLGIGVYLFKRNK